MGGFSRNETLELMYLNTSDAIRKIADFIERHEMQWQDVVILMRESSDELEAQSIVVKLRDDLTK